MSGTNRHGIRQSSCGLSITHAPKLNIGSSTPSPSHVDGFTAICTLSLDLISLKIPENYPGTLSLQTCIGIVITISTFIYQHFGSSHIILAHIWRCFRLPTLDTCSLIHGFHRLPQIHEHLFEYLIYTLPMLRLLWFKSQGCKDFWKPSKPCHVGIHWTAFVEYSQMNTHVLGFQYFLRFFALFVLAKLAISSIRVNPSNAEATLVQITMMQRFLKTI